LQIIESTLFLSRTDAGGAKDAATRRTDTGIGVEAGEDLLDQDLSWRGRRRRGGAVSG